MTQALFTCPQCFYTGVARSDLKFCPRCGTANPIEAAADHSPLDIRVNGQTYQALDRIAIGSISIVYRCQLSDGKRQGVIKVARDARTNPLLANEVKVLRKLFAADPNGKFTPFLPRVEASFSFGDNPARQANVLSMHPDIQSSDELYTLWEVESAYPNGIDLRDAAWIWRRLLNVLGFIHSNGIVHGAVPL